MRAKFIETPLKVFQIIMACFLKQIFCEAFFHTLSTIHQVHDYYIMWEMWKYKFCDPKP